MLPRKVNIRIGGGFVGSDTSVNKLGWNLPHLLRSNWNAKLDIVYKFYGLDRDFDGKWNKAHAFGLFLNGGMQTSQNLVKLLPQNQGELVNMQSPTQPFFEAETGLMLREEWRISGGMGMAQWTSTIGDISTIHQTPYASFTTGLSPRLFSFLELDILASALLIENQIRPRASVNAVLLFKTWKR